MLSVLICSSQILKAIGVIAIWNPIGIGFGFVIKFILLWGLIFSYGELKELISDNHPERFKKIKKSLKYFYVFELFGLGTTILIDVIH